jgi:excisionase family DNA binding protein
MQDHKSIYKEREMTSEKLTVTVEEAGALLGIGRGLAYEMAKTGRLPVLRFGKRMVVPRRLLDDMLQTAINYQPVNEIRQAS